MSRPSSIWQQPSVGQPAFAQSKLGLLTAHRSICTLASTLSSVYCRSCPTAGFSTAEHSLASLELLDVCRSAHCCRGSLLFVSAPPAALPHSPPPGHQHVSTHYSSPTHSLLSQFDSCSYHQFPFVPGFSAQPWQLRLPNARAARESGQQCRLQRIHHVRRISVASGGSC
jgi:hypothetical protein